MSRYIVTVEFEVIASDMRDAKTQVEEDLDAVEREHCNIIAYEVKDSWKR